MLLAIAFSGFPLLAMAQEIPAGTRLTPNDSGVDAAFSSVGLNGVIDLSHPFFQPIALLDGGNERSCGSCHRPDQGWSVTPERLQALFDLTDGLDPVFLPVDGTNAANSDRSTVEARRVASSLLLSKGLIRVDRPVLPTFQFDLVAVSVPADGTFPADFAAQAVTRQVITVFRRPPPTSNLELLTDLMWDGREANPNLALNARLLQQAINAARGHLNWNTLAFGFNGLTPEQKVLFQSIVDFEKSIWAAQGLDLVEPSKAGPLFSEGAFGGPLALQALPFEIFAGSGTFNLFSAWAGTTVDPAKPGFLQTPGRQQIARGEALFNTRTFRTGFVGTVSCATCHNVRPVGNEANARRFNLGLSAFNLTIDGIAVNADLPIYTIRNKATAQLLRTTDPGRFATTGTFGSGDGDSFKVPSLRNLAARAPYFHGGQAKDLTAVVNFYNTRFNIGLTDEEKADMIAFLRSL
jgi:cytochrome c peroxidase